MSEQAAQFDFSDDDSLTGFRLERFELFNWGTFDRHVWRIEPGGRNSLLTGDIGSGKSTLVDALTTLLVPHNRIIYNKAAGAEGRERSLYSYIRGEYKSEQDAFTQHAKPVALRDGGSYTVLLAWFRNRGFDQGATLAQVFWLREGQRNPERFFVFAEQPLTIAEHFSGFGGDILDLKKRLRKRQRVAVLDNFKEYAGRFRHLFGIQQQKALDLFYQTVSMKSVGNLTDFVRQHMLEQSDTEERIDALRRAFDNLNQAHGAVLKAKAQIERLTPLMADGRRHREISQEIETLTACREALSPWFAGEKVRLTGALIERLQAEIDQLSRRMAKLQGEIAAFRLKADSLKAGIEDSGGSRLRAIDQEIARLGPERQRRQLVDERYQGFLKRLDLPQAQTDELFHANRQRAEGMLERLGEESFQLDRQKTDLAVELRKLKDQGEQLEQELVSLRGRKSNIPLQQLELRRLLVEDLGVDEEALPFAGELLQVDPSEQRWEGAIERLLHNFGLSLLVPEQHYERVSYYVERTRLKGRLVYYRTRSERGRLPRPEPNALCRKLRIRPESPFYEWLDAWLARHFDHICCEEMTAFRRLPKAITRQGQIKSGGRRHEKDDRHRLEERSRYVLGWSNEEKIRALEAEQGGVAAEVIRLATGIDGINGQLSVVERRRDSARDLLNIDPFEEIRWQATAAEIQSLQEEKRCIEESSDRLKDLRTQLRMVEGAVEKKALKERGLIEQRGNRNARLQTAREEREAALALAATLDARERERLLPRLEALREEALERPRLTLQNLVSSEQELRGHIQRLLNNERGRLGSVNTALIAAMQRYKNDFPAETQEVDAAVEALPEYAAMLQALEQEDLPRHETRFREMLKEETIQGVAMFQAQLEREQREIEQKIDTINRSLQEIEYNPGSYIMLIKDPTPDTEIRDFREQLRQVLSDALDEAELYSEGKFLQVKKIIDRFNGREGLVDQDRRWTRKVTDVRNWFNFSASERYLADGEEKEFYSDTAGKSGGQKEKLAYTILASALAYQFGLEWGHARSRSFRFVVIDEAFGRGSDESTRYALELFRKLNLQLLIVTPLQKIHVIEEYINAVHFVHNDGGHNSILRNLTVEEYRQEKQRFLANANA